MATPSRQIFTMSEVIDLTGVSEDSIRREMKKGLPSRFQNGRRRFLRCDVEQWFKIGDAVPSTPVKSFLPVRMTRDAREIPGQLRREPSRRAVP
jgi:predicted DNA-binding transcriptional regulator AlpA